MVEMWCPKCRGKQEAIEVREEIIITKKGGKRKMLKGICGTCGRKVNQFLGSVKGKEEPYFEPPIEQAGDSLEKEQIKKFRKDVKNDKILKRNGIETIDTKKEKPIKKSYYNLFKYFLIILGIGLIVFAYLIYSGYLNDEIDLICGNSTQICGNVTCDGSGYSPCYCDVVCGNLSCNFPSDLEIKLVNGSL